MEIMHLELGLCLSTVVVWYNCLFWDEIVIIHISPVIGYLLRSLFLFPWASYHLFNYSSINLFCKWRNNIADYHTIADVP